LEEYGFETVIADAKELLLDGKALLIGGRPIDLVYNRLVDFALEEPRHAALQAAYLGGKVVVTPTTNMRTPGGGFAPVLEVHTPLEGS